jgi:predicted metal-dependent peptidase
MANESQALDEVSRAAFALLLKEPFYAHILAGMPREASDTVKTTGTAWDGQQVRLRVNPEFFIGGLTAPQRTGVLKHEILHVAFRHVFRGADRDAKIFSVAADLVVNQLVKPYPLPDGYPTLADFPDLGLLPDKSVEDYYGVLMQLLREMQQAGFGGDEPTDGQDGEEDAEGGDGDPQNASGNHSGGSGSASKPGKGSKGKTRGGAAAGEPEWAGGTSAPKSAAALAKFLGDQEGRGDDSGWHDGNDGVSAAGRYAVGNLLLRARERMPPHQWGTMPSALVSQLELILAERQPKIDWKRMVRIFCASSGRSRIRHTIKRISKRYGTRPGIKVQRLQRLLVAVDTSGSIDQNMVEEFFTEIHGTWKVGATVVIVECDADVQRSYDYRGKPPKAVKGGGGTEFEPVFQWMRKQRPFDGVLYLTDGYGPAPSTRPNCKLLWVISDGGSTEELPFGPTVRIPAARE